MARGKTPPRSATRVALVRYRREDWTRWRETVDDPELFGCSYEAWLKEAEARAARMRKANLEVVWIEQEPEPIAAWCRERGLRNTNETRFQHAAEQIGNVRPRSIKPPG
jgi:hypothetical protein